MIAVLGQAFVEMFEDHDRAFIQAQLERFVIDGLRTNVEFEMDEQGIAAAGKLD